MRRLILFITVLLSSCSYLNLPTSHQYPSLAMNPTDCAVLGTVLAPMLGLTPIASSSATFGAIAGSTVCKAESSLVNGPPAQITVTSQTMQGTTKPVNP